MCTAVVGEVGERKKMRVVVVGAGIVGTTTAYRLKRRYPDIHLRIVAERLSPHTTSDIGAYNRYKNIFCRQELSRLATPLQCRPFDFDRYQCCNF